MLDLQWKTIIPSNHPNYMVKGHELNQALAGRQSRFAIIEVRMYDKNRHSELMYRIRDADTVTDAEVKAGIRPKVVLETRDWDAVEKFVLEAK